jgi:hypothetical protein
MAFSLISKVDLENVEALYIIFYVSKLLCITLLEIKSVVSVQNKICGNKEFRFNVITTLSDPFRQEMGIAAFKHPFSYII